MKALFIPLKTRWFRAFERGEKRDEWRPRWNEKTLIPGRAVTLSHGYCGDRLHRTLIGFESVEASRAAPEAREIYPNIKVFARLFLGDQKL
jgi:hypothetical protein